MPGLFKHPYARYQREAIGVSLRKNPFIQAMQYPEAFGFSSVYPLSFAPCAGLPVWVLRWFQVFLASSPFSVSANSYYFYSIVRPLLLRQFWCVNAE